VCDLVDPPRRNKPEIQTWDAAQAARALATGDRSDLAALWRLALLCGLRRGELLGLKWENVDLERGALAVRRTLTRGPGGAWELGQPKTASGRRAVALPESCVTALRKHRAAQHTHRLAIGPAWEDHGFVFTNATGAPLHTNALIGRFERLIRDTDLPRIRFHDLRHTCATLHLARKTQPKVVQELLGHSNISMTLDRYSHVTETMQRDAAAAIDELIDAAKSAAS
jgi:integrase